MDDGKFQNFLPDMQAKYSLSTSSSPGWIGQLTPTPHVLELQHLEGLVGMHDSTP